MKPISNYLCFAKFGVPKTILQPTINPLVHQTSNQEGFDEFGPFAVAFAPIGDDDTPYLSLLHLSYKGSLEVVRAIRDATTHPDAVACAVLLLRDPNWRPHLVGAVAAYYLRTAKTTAQMWSALDSGSWVTPQLAAILSRCDHEFAANASSRLINLCPLSENPECAIESPIARHSAQGPAGSHHRSCKSAASLFALLKADLPSSDIVAEFASHSDLQSLIADDFDGSAELATSWRERFLDLDSQL